MEDFEGLKISFKEYALPHFLLYFLDRLTAFLVSLISKYTERLQSSGFLGSLGSISTLLRIISHNLAFRCARLLFNTG